MTPASAIISGSAPNSWTDKGFSCNHCPISSLYFYLFLLGDTALHFSLFWYCWYNGTTSKTGRDFTDGNSLLTTLSLFVKLGQTCKCSLDLYQVILTFLINYYFCGLLRWRPKHSHRINYSRQILCYGDLIQVKQKN